MTIDLEKKSSDHLVHELRHVLLALQATKRMLLRSSKDTSVMVDLQTQSIERLGEIIEFYESQYRNNISVNKDL